MPQLPQLFMMSKIQNLNGTHNIELNAIMKQFVVYDVKDTKFEWNSQPAIKIVSAIVCCL